MTFPGFHPESASLIKKHLTAERYQALRNLKTARGFTLDMAIRSGLAHADSSVGIYAGDPESYTLFAKVFTPIIREYHHLPPNQVHQEAMTAQALPLLDPEGRFIRSVRVRVARNLSPYPFSCHLTSRERLAVEEKTCQALDVLPSPLSGQYTGYGDLDPDALQSLVDRKTAFPKGDRFQEAAGMNRDFPLGRGIFLSDDQTFRVWVNEEDHLRIMAQKQGSDLGSVYNTLCRGLACLSQTLPFAYDETLGYLNACPTNLGTGMRAGVHICLPKLGQHPAQLADLTTRHHLQVRGTRGEKTAVENAVFDISNARRMGVSADQILQDLYQGLWDIIHTETQR